MDKKQLVINGIKNRSLIAIIRGVESKDLLNFLNALYSAGFRFAEITFGKKSDDEIFEDLKLAVNNYGDKMFIGAGTVTSENRMKLASDAGCDYLISPVLNTKLIDFCNQKGLVSIVGGLTPSEIKLAYDSGANFVKVFPSSAFGPNYFKELKAPLGEIPLIAFGGITLQNVNEFLNAGAVSVGVCGALINHELIKKGDFNGITQIAKQFLSATKNN